VATTAQDIFLDARALLDEYTEEGVLTPDSDVIDLQTKAIRFIDMAQKELYKTGKLFKTFSYTNMPYENALGFASNFNIVEYLGTTQYYPVGGVVAKAYYFEVDSECTVKVQEFQAGAWVDLIPVVVPATVESMTAYKGAITPTTAGNLIRLAFEGSYYYKHQNRCLFTAPFKASKVPDYRPWIKLVMPTDFRAVDVVVNEFPERQYQKDANYKWEGFKDLYVNYFYNGTIRVIYKPVPVTITAITDTLEIDDITVKAISFYVAAKLAPFENQNLVNYFEGEFTKLKVDSFINMPQSEESMINIYGGGMSGI
jgi:hypothetical protein